MDYHNPGRVIERMFLQELVKAIKDVQVLYEKDLMKLYGWSASGVDYLIEMPEGLVVVQIKYIKTRRRETHAINNFLSSAKHISTCMQRPILFGIWVSRLEPFPDNICSLGEEQIYTVSCFESMELLVQRAIALVKTKLFKEEEPISMQQ
jgi:hypothetical protein